MHLLLTDEQRKFLDNNPREFIGKSTQEKLDILTRLELEGWSKTDDLPGEKDDFEE